MAQTTEPKPTANILGSARAETDLSMLERAFLETADYRALVGTQDFNFVVGRRGTGKSALFQRVKDHFGQQKGVLTFADRPQEHQALALQAALANLGGTYREMRAITRLAWKAHLLLWVLPRLLGHHRLSGTETRERLLKHAERHQALLPDHTPARVHQVVHTATSKVTVAAAAPEMIARIFELSSLQDDIRRALAESHLRALILLDGLDEGWSPSESATAALGGLASAVSDFDEAQLDLHGTLFIRDNMFRALAHFDQDFSRHIEGNTLRLHWDEATLLELVASRIRVALGLEKIENPERVWNRFTAFDLHGRSGFAACLRYTLYRPRDILVLVNRAHFQAIRRGQDQISSNSLEGAATEISHDRLDDLIKEYAKVLPGVGPFVRAFEGRAAIETVATISEHLDQEIASGAYEQEADSDFALLGSGRAVLSALYGIGFLGLEDKSRKLFTFKHDGASSDIAEVPSDLKTVVHPCYWKALEIKTSDDAESLLVEINDEFETPTKLKSGDLRVRQLGQIVSDLGKIPVGPDGAAEFEEWVLRSVKLLFAGKLKNPQLHPNADAVQRRDVVARNAAEAGIWRRVREDYGTRQIVLEVKNYEELKPDDYRQIISYTTGEYGSFGIIVHRGSNESVSERDRGWLQTLYHEHGRLVLTIPDLVLRRAISKIRNADRHDYIEEQLARRLDTFVRVYLSLKQTARFRSGQRRPKP